MSEIELPKPYRFKDFIKAMQDDPDALPEKWHHPQTIRIQKGVKK